MAEGLFRDRLYELGVDGVPITSTGVAGLERAPAVPEAIQAMAELGIDISDHVARRFHAEQAMAADLVITMTEEQADIVDRLAPQVADRTFTLKELVSLLDDAAWPDGPGRRTRWIGSAQPLRPPIAVVWMGRRRRRPTPISRTHWAWGSRRSAPWPGSCSS